MNHRTRIAVVVLPAGVLAIALTVFLGGPRGKASNAAFEMGRSDLTPEAPVHSVVERVLPASAELSGPTFPNLMRSLGAPGTEEEEPHAIETEAVIAQRAMTELTLGELQDLIDRETRALQELYPAFSKLAESRERIYGLCEYDPSAYTTVNTFPEHGKKYHVRIYRGEFPEYFVHLDERARIQAVVTKRLEDL